MSRHVYAFFLAFFVTASTSSVCSGQKWSGIYRADIKNRYLGTTTCGIFADEPVIQQELDVARTFHNGRTALTVSVWNSTGFSNAPDTYAFETDVNTNLSHMFGKYTVSVGDWIFYLTPIAGTNVNIIDAKVSRTFIGDKNIVVPFVEIQRFDPTRRTAIGHGGSFPMIGFGWNRRLTKRFSIETLAHANYDANGTFGRRARKTLVRFEGGLTTRLGESTTLTLPRFEFGGGINDPASGENAGRPLKTVWGAGISKTF